MTETTETVDLWGDIVTEPIRTPSAIMKEQGALLEQKTKGILSVIVSTENIGRNTFQHKFIIKSPSLNYNFQLFYINQPIELFPLTFYSEVAFGINNKNADTEAEFIEILKEILQSAKTQNVVNSLLSQSIAA